MVFDTLLFARKLEVAGVQKPVAEAHSELLSETLEEFSEDLATQKDLKILEKNLRNEIEKMSLNLTIRVGGMFVVAIGILATLIKIL